MKYNIKTITYVLPIVIIAPVYNIPRFFEFDSNPQATKITQLKCSFDDAGNETFIMEDQDSVEIVVKMNQTIWNEMEVHCHSWQEKTVHTLTLTDTRENKLYFTVRTKYCKCDKKYLIWSS